jgi:hypothetical protein
MIVPTATVIGWSVGLVPTNALVSSERSLFTGWPETGFGEAWIAFPTGGSVSRIVVHGAVCAGNE